MSETASKPVKLVKTVKTRLEVVTPIQIVDVWRLVEHSLRDGGQVYPDISEDSPEKIRSNLFEYMQLPAFAGLMAKVGKKPVGIILGHLAGRPYGRPSRYQFIWGFWVEPAFRKSGVGKALWNAYSTQLKKAGIFNCEFWAHDHVEKQLCREVGVPVTKLLSILGVRL